MMAAVWSAEARTGSGAKCAYRCVVAAFRCPSSYRIIKSEPPADAAADGKLCRSASARYVVFDGTQRAYSSRQLLVFDSALNQVGIIPFGF